MKKPGFTLSEVLITLGIIGVVAAITLPVVIKNIEHRQLYTALKRNYSILQQALTMLNNDLGYTVTSSNFEATSMTKEKFCKYFNYARCDYPVDVSRKCQNYLTYNKAYQANSNNCDDGMVLLRDGTAIYRDYTGWFIVDVNGPYRKPNALGHDVFAFSVNNKGQLKPVAASWPYLCSKNKNDKGVFGNDNGLGCTKKALTDKNYWKELP